VTDRVAGFAGGGGVIAIRVCTGIAVVTAGGGEVLAGFFSGFGHRAELVQVHRVGALGTGGDIGDLALVAHITNRDAVVAIRQRVGTEGDAVVGQRHRRVAQRRAVGARRPGTAADGGGVGS